MRTLALAAALLALAGCQTGVDPGEVYTFEPGSFEPDSVPNIEQLDAAAEQGDEKAQFQVVFLRYFMPGEYKTAISEFERLAADDNVNAMEMLAYAYQHGKGVPVDYEQSARWLERASALGSASATRDLELYRANG